MREILSLILIIIFDFFHVELFSLSKLKPNIMKTTNDSGIPKAGDDAKEVISIPLDEIGVKDIGDDWFDDHLTILLDFKERISNKRYELVNRNGELYQNVARSTCASFE